MKISCKKVDFASDSELFELCESLANVAFPPHEMLFPTTFSEYKSKHELLAFFQSDLRDDIMGCCAGDVEMSDEFMGFCALILRSSFVYLAFFAIKDELRGRGCGARVLKYLRKRYQKPIVLEAEKPYIGANDLALRVRRAGFYERCGFARAEQSIAYFDEIYDIYCSEFDDEILADYKAMYEDFARQKSATFELKKDNELKKEIN